MPVQIKAENMDKSLDIANIVKKALANILAQNSTPTTGSSNNATNANNPTPQQNQKLNIICLSNQQWDYPLPTNKRHVMERLSKLGHNVLFVDPPINTGRLFLRQILRKQWSLNRLLTQTYKHANLTVFSPLNFVPDTTITSSIHVSKIESLAKKIFDPNLKTVLWVYHVEIPEIQKYVKEISHDLLVYDCVDNYTAFPDRSTFYSATISRAKIIEQEAFLATNADLVFATAPGLIDKLKQYRDEVHYTPNVGDYEKFKNVPKMKDQIPQDLADIRRPRIGFTGAIDEYKFDRELVAKAAKAYPNYNFVIIGPFALKDKEGSKEELGFTNLDNVHFLGSKPYDQLPNYFAGFDAYIIPFQLNDYTVGGCFPVKFHDALAAGMPVVVTDLPAYAPFKDNCYISKSPEDFIANLERSLKEDSAEKIKNRQAVAAENNWDGKVTKLLSLINSALIESFKQV